MLIAQTKCRILVRMFLCGSKDACGLSFHTDAKSISYVLPFLNNSCQSIFQPTPTQSAETESRKGTRSVIVGGSRSVQKGVATHKLTPPARRRPALGSQPQLAGTLSTCMIQNFYLNLSVGAYSCIIPCHLLNFSLTKGSF